MSVKTQTVLPSVTLAQLRGFLQNFEASFGEVRDILVKEDRTVVQLGPSKWLSGRQLDIALDDQQNASPPDGKDIVVRGTAFIMGVPRNILAFR